MKDDVQSLLRSAHRSKFLAIFLKSFPYSWHAWSQTLALTESSWSALEYIFIKSVSSLETNTQVLKGYQEGYTTATLGHSSQSHHHHFF